MTLCVYALTSADIEMGRTRGLAREPLRAISAGSITAIVGDLRRAPRPTAANLRRYTRTIETLSGRVAALLPVRFGTCVGDVNELKFDLRSRQASLRRSLRAVRNRVQMTVRVVQTQRDRGANPPGLPRKPKRFAPQVSSGTNYLRSRAAEAERAKHVPGFDAVRAAVRRWVKEERVEKRGAVASIYHLVPRRSVDVYRRALKHAARDAGVRLVLSGPWPPYAFTDGW